MKTFLLLAIFLSIAVHLSQQEPGGRRRRRGFAEVTDRRFHHRNGVIEAERRVNQRHGAAAELESNTEELDRRARRGRGHRRARRGHRRARSGHRRRRG